MIQGYVESMLKRVFELFGLVIMGFGVYFIVVERTKVNVCNAAEGSFVGFGVKPSCQHVIYAYFGGFMLLAAGMLVVVFGLLSTRRAAKYRSSAKPSIASQYVWTDPRAAGPQKP